MIQPARIKLTLLSCFFALLPSISHAAEATSKEKVLPPCTTTTTSGCRNLPLLTFPEDYGTHPGFDREWWYYVGNGTLSTGERVGFMYAVLREHSFYVTTLSVMGKSIPNGYMQTIMVSPWYNASNQNKNGVFTLNTSDIFQNNAHFVHDFNQKKIWIEASIRNFSNTLHFTMSGNLAKDPVLQGDHGFSQKSQVDPRVASYYISETRINMDPTSMFEINGTSYTVGAANVYHDHEIMNTVPHAKIDFVGWDWMGLQFLDNTEITAFQMRKSNQQPYNYEQRSWTEVDTSGKYANSTQSDSFSLEPLAFQMADSGISYPSSFKLERQGHTYYIAPLVSNSEIGHFFGVGWFEGAVDVFDDAAMTHRVGSGFVEMSGYGRRSDNKWANSLLEMIQELIASELWKKL